MIIALCVCSSNAKSEGQGRNVTCRQIRKCFHVNSHVFGVSRGLFCIQFHPHKQRPLARQSTFRAGSLSQEAKQCLRSPAGSIFPRRDPGGRLGGPTGLTPKPWLLQPVPACSHQHQKSHRSTFLRHVLGERVPSADRCWGRC